MNYPRLGYGFVFIMASIGSNDEGAAAKIRTFLETAVKFNPVNMGNDIGIMYKPEKDLSFAKLYLTGRKEKLTPQEAIVVLEDSGHAMAVFDNPEALQGFLKEVKLTPEKAAAYTAKFCVCGAFNSTRAIRILNDVRTTN
jgi:hypothetical protein